MAAFKLETDRQLAARVGITKQDISDRMAALGTRFPGFQDGRNFFGGLVDAQRAAIQKH
jgi:hypothetical protein